MSISFTSVKCPACGAELSVNSEKEFSFCSYCGSKILLNNENEHIYRSIDEARLKEAETERLIRLKELELEEIEAARSRKGILAGYGAAALCAAIGALICIFNAAGAAGIMIGAYIALFTYIKSDEKKKNKRKFVSSSEVRITDAMEDYSDKNYHSMLLMYKGAGFTDITTIPLNDLNMFNQKKNGQVDEVTINGESDFSEGDIFPKNSSVVITYHSRG